MNHSPLVRKYFRDLTAYYSAVSFQRNPVNKEKEMKLREVASKSKKEMQDAFGNENYDRFEITASYEKSDELLKENLTSKRYINDLFISGEQLFSHLAYEVYKPELSWKKFLAGMTNKVLYNLVLIDGDLDKTLSKPGCLAKR